MEPHWDYDDTEQWGDLCEQFTLCAQGSNQSPIDLSSAAQVPLKPLQFDYHTGTQALFNNGLTVQVQCASNSGMIYNGHRYTLGQFHFHHPSEHTIDGQLAAMELHLVHKDLSTAALAVVAVMIYPGADDNPNYAPIFDRLPCEICQARDGCQLRFNPGDLLPDDLSHFYTYYGSLTTPPCSENVRWFVLGTPVSLSQAQIDAFANVYAHNARPIQPRNHRPLLHT